MNEPVTNPDPIALPEDNPDALNALGAEAAEGVNRERKLIFLLVLAAAAFIALAQFTPLRAWLANTQEWKRFIQDFGWQSRVAFLGLTTLSVMLGVPRLALAASAGLLFGFAEGAAVSLLGSLLGSYGLFIAVRKGFRRRVAEQANRRPWLAALLRRPSLTNVFWIRQLPLPGAALNALLALSAIRHRTFLAGTLLGYIPLNLAATLAGSGLGKSSLTTAAVQLMAALAVINVALWLVWRRFKKTSPAPSSSSTSQPTR